MTGHCFRRCRPAIFHTLAPRVRGGFARYTFGLGVCLAIVLAQAAAYGQARPGATPPPPKDARPFVRFDAEQYETSVSTRQVDLTGAPEGAAYVAGYSYAGKIPIRPASVAFLVSATHRNRDWIKINTITFKYGDTNSPPYPAVYESDYYPVKNKLVLLERLAALIPTDDFLKIANAPAVSFSIAGHSYAIQQGYLAPLQEIAKTIPAADKPPPAKKPDEKAPAAKQ